MAEDSMGLRRTSWVKASTTHAAAATQAMVSEDPVPALSIDLSLAAGIRTTESC